MKCLSLKQPYAQLLVSGKKTIEIRTWNTKFRGPFLIHASKKINKEACNRLKVEQSKLITGAILGKATLSDVKVYETRNSFIRGKNKHFAGSKYEKRKYGFIINHALKFKNPIPIQGRLGFFDVNSENIQ